MGRRPWWPPRDPPVLLRPHDWGYLSHLISRDLPLSCSSLLMPCPSEISSSLSPSHHCLHPLLFLPQRLHPLPPSPPSLTLWALPSRYGKVLLMSPKSGAGENFEVIFLKKPSNCFSWETKIFFRILNFVALFTVLDCFYFELDR